MPNYDGLTAKSAAIEAKNSAQPEIEKKNLPDYLSLAVTTFGVGYIPLAPGTWGSAVGVLIYLLFAKLEEHSNAFLIPKGWNETQITAWIHVLNLLLFLLFCFLGIWSSSRATKLFQTKDPQKVVVDEVMGQLLVFLFVPFDISWKFVLVGFLLFRLFDIWKPYPIDYLESLPMGIGICADDLLAGVYGGISLSFIYAVSLSV